MRYTCEHCEFQNSPPHSTIVVIQQLYWTTFTLCDQSREPCNQHNNTVEDLDRWAHNRWIGAAYLFRYIILRSWVHIVCVCFCMCGRQVLKQPQLELHGWWQEVWNHWSKSVTSTQLLTAHTKKILCIDCQSRCIMGYVQMNYTAKLLM